MIKNRGGSRQTATVATVGSTPTATGPIATSKFPDRIPQPRMITIFCWILGVSTSISPVDIEDSLSVGHLKREITKKISNTSPGVDAHQLTLWRVSIPTIRQLKNSVNEHQFLEEESLLAGDLLEEIFPPP